MGSNAAKLTGLFLFVAAILSTGEAAAEDPPATPTPWSAGWVLPTEPSRPAIRPPQQEQPAPTEASVTPSTTPDALTATPTPSPSPTPVASTPTPSATQQPFGASFGSIVARSLLRRQHELKREEFRDVPAAVDELLQEEQAQVGIVVKPLEGSAFYMRNAFDAYPLASVIKVYMLAAYLDRVEAEERPLEEDEIAMLEAMIEVSDNESAEEIWRSLGGFDAMQEYLGTHALQRLQSPVTQQLAGGAEIEPEAWGDAAQTPASMADFLSRLRTHRLLNDENTLLASRLLGRVVEAQSWGVNAGVADFDADAQVLFKNGWYPGNEGWRINSAGIVLPSEGGEPYVLVIFGQGFENWDEGIETVEAIATLINQVMLG